MKNNVNLEIDKIKYLFEYELGKTTTEQKRLLNEYDIDDDNKESYLAELTSDGGSEIMGEIGVSTDLESLKDSGEEMFCQFSDIDSYVNNKFGSIVKEKFKDEAQKALDTIKEYIEKFIDFLGDLKISDLKKLFKEIKKKKTEVSSEEGGESLNEFFGTTMALVSIGSFTMPALVLTIASVTLVTLIGIWLIKTILCAFNISITTKKRCRVRSFSWGQCS
jgi:hypothetical protein